MKFFLDQDVYLITSRFFSSLGHDVVTASKMGLSRAKDDELLKLAQEQNRLFVTRDRDFGSLVFVNALGSGVLYLRMTPTTQNAVHNTIKIVLENHTEDELSKAFVVVEPGSYRIRKIK